MSTIHIVYMTQFLLRSLPRWRARLRIRESGFDSWHTLTACGSSDDKEVKGVFGRPGARVGVGFAR